MNKWYRKTGVKAIVLIVAILSGAMLITNLLSLMNLAGSTDLPSLCCLLYTSDAADEL